MDGLSELFTTPKPAGNTLPTLSAGSPAPARTTLPLRYQPGTLPGRSPAQANNPIGQGNASGPINSEPGVAKKLNFAGQGLTALDALERDISTVIAKLKTAEDDEVLLIIDQPDFLLASTGPSYAIGATEMMDWATGLQQVCRRGIERSIRTTSRGTTLMLLTGRSCYSTDVGCGFATSTQCTGCKQSDVYTSRVGTCRICDWVGASGSVGHAAPHSGDRSRKGREWGVADQPRWRLEYWGRGESRGKRTAVLHPARWRSPGVWAWGVLKEWLLVG